MATRAGRIASEMRLSTTLATNTSMNTTRTFSHPHQQLPGRHLELTLCFSAFWNCQSSSWPWLVMTKHRLTISQSTCEVALVNPARPWAQPRTPASPFRALARTASRPLTGGTPPAVLLKAEAPCPPHAGRQTYCLSRRYRSSQTSSSVRPRPSQRLPFQKPPPPSLEPVSISSWCSPY